MSGDSKLGQSFGPTFIFTAGTAVYSGFFMDPNKVCFNINMGKFNTIHFKHAQLNLKL